MKNKFVSVMSERISMKKTVLALAAILLSSTLAQEALSVGFNDSNFPYYDQSKGYVNVALDGNTLMLNLHSDATNGVELKFEQEIKHASGRDDGEAGYRQGQLRKLAGVEAGPRTIELSHKGANLNEVVDRYSTMLSELGFVRSVDSTYPNTRIYLFDHQGQLVRGFFTRLPNDKVRVRLTTAI